MESGSKVRAVHPGVPILAVCANYLSRPDMELRAMAKS